MSQFVETGTRTFTAAGALGAHLRVKTPGALALAGSTDIELGTMAYPCLAAGPATVRLRTAQGTAKFVVADAITAGNPVYAASSGKISASGTVLIGIALEASTTNGDIIEVLRRQETSDAAAAGGTTAAAFLVDSDSAIPKIELASQTGGTGDFKATIKPPATLGASRIYTLPVDAAASFQVDACFAGTPAATATAGNAIPVGYSAVAVGTVTNDANDWMTLPAIASVPIGFQIVIACNAGGNFELRTPASSNTTINGQDSDGTKEYLCTDTDVVIVTKATTTNWVAQSLTSLGAVRTAVVPD